MNERFLRYRSKISVVTEKLEGIGLEPRSSLERDAILFRVQVAVEATMDIIAMLVKDHGRDVRDDYHNIEVLAELRTVTPSLARQLKKLNGLRNAIAHKYNTFEEAAVFRNRETIRASLEAFLTRVEHELKTLFGKDTG